MQSVPPAERESPADADAPARPRLRGHSHAAALVVWAGAGTWRVASAPPGWARAATALYAAAIAILFGVSALYHVPAWPAPTKRRLRRLDHASIFLTVAGTYTAIGGIALTGAWRATLLTVVWAGAVAGIVLALVWIDAPRRVHAAAYLALGWVAVASLPALLTAIGATGVALLVAGGILYTLGALVYARRRPDPWPATFGYHEIFHLLVIAAVIAHAVVVAVYVLPVR